MQLLYTLPLSKPNQGFVGPRHWLMSGHLHLLLGKNNETNVGLLYYPTFFGLLFAVHIPGKKHVYGVLTL